MQGLLDQVWTHRKKYVRWGGLCLFKMHIYAVSLKIEGILFRIEELPTKIDDNWLWLA